MPVFTRPDAEIHYEVHGSGFPLLLFAPGGLRSQLEYWRRSPSNPAAPPPSRTRSAWCGSATPTVSEDVVTPLLLQPGSDQPHPAETSAEIARLAPDLAVQKDWRAPAHLAESIRRVTEFLTRHTPRT
jgi:hypothetical protein